MTTTHNPAPTDLTPTENSKVPEVTLVFWIIKILATTLGETGGDALSMGESSDTASSMSAGQGYLIATAIFLVPFVFMVIVQAKAKRFHPAIYWLTIVTTTMLGTTIADYATRDLGIGYEGGSALLVALLIGSFVVWRAVMGSVSFRAITSPRAELFYWITIMFSQTLGTALGDYVADDEGGLALGYGVSAAVFGGLLAVLIGLYFGTKVSRVLLFWLAFVLTRPLGAVVGDLLDKPLEDGGLQLSRYGASGVLIAAMLVLIFALPHKAARTVH